MLKGVYNGGIPRVYHGGIPRCVPWWHTQGCTMVAYPGVYHGGIPVYTPGWVWWDTRIYTRVVGWVYPAVYTSGCVYGGIPGYIASLVCIWWYTRICSLPVHPGYTYHPGIYPTLYTPGYTTILPYMTWCTQHTPGPGSARR